ncbi:hypothetical protein [Lentisalinibacter sediminis]|uniref:hypothetical protein n=1 Tax=Lentisalinibacter sediminis TaxID=2992237 RepID=UPI003864DF78
MSDISEWLKVMLEEIDRKEEESRESAADQGPARDDKEKGVPVRPGEGGNDAGDKKDDG